MKKLFVLTFITMSFWSFAQEPYTNCSAVFLNNKMLVEEYSDTAKCKISIDAKGEMVAATVELNKDNSRLVEKFSFSVAVKDKDTGTMMLLTKEPIKKIEVEKVLAKCRKGDKIVVLTTENEFALPHNEILVY